MGKSLVPSRNIRYALVDNLIIIMDFRTENYFALDASATKIWLLLVQHSGNIDRVCSDLQDQVEEEKRDSVFSGLRIFINDCKDRGFLEDSQSSHFSFIPKAPGLLLRTHFNGLGSPTLAALVSLYQTVRMLRQHGFSITYGFYSKSFDARVSHPSKVTIQQMLTAFLRAENFVSLADAPNDCLPRSLALFRFLRTMGISCKHYIGVRRYPSMTMHAWVEHENQVLVDRAESKDFIPLATID